MLKYQYVVVNFIFYMFGWGVWDYVVNRVNQVQSIQISRVEEGPQKL